MSTNDMTTVEALLRAREMLEQADDGPRSIPLTPREYFVVFGRNPPDVPFGQEFTADGMLVVLVDPKARLPLSPLPT